MVKRFCCKPRTALGEWPVYDRDTNLFVLFVHRSYARQTCALLNQDRTLAEFYAWRNT